MSLLSKVLLFGVMVFCVVFGAMRLLGPGSKPSGNGNGTVSSEGALDPPANQRVKVSVLTSGTHKDKLKKLADEFNHQPENRKFYVDLALAREGNHALHALLSGADKDAAGWLASARSLAERESAAYREAEHKDILRLDDPDISATIDKVPMVFLVKRLSWENDEIHKALRADNPWPLLLNAKCRFAFSPPDEAASGVLTLDYILWGYETFVSSNEPSAGEYRGTQGRAAFLKELKNHYEATNEGSSQLAADFAKGDLRADFIVTYASLAEQLAKESNDALKVVYPREFARADYTFAVLLTANSDAQEGARQFMTYVKKHYPRYDDVNLPSDSNPIRPHRYLPDLNDLVAQWNAR